MKEEVKKYAITEIITTGLNFKLDRIIHISTFIIENREIKHHLTTYINPERNLEVEIIRSTGIRNDNIKFSPKFYEKAKDLVTLWQDCVIVSSNIRLTYAFLKKEFESLGFPFNMNHISYPNYSYELVKNSRVEEKARILASNFLEQQLEQINKKKDFTPRAFLEKEIKLIPNDCGIYLLKNQNGSIIYVGKAIKIRTRLRQHFRNLNNKGFKIHQMVAAIDYKVTGSELFALLLEHYYILKYRPELNKALRGDNYTYELRYIKDDKAPFQFLPTRKTPQGHSIKRFKTRKSALSFLTNISWIFFHDSEQLKVHGISNEKLSEILEFEHAEGHNNLIDHQELLEHINPFYKGKYVLKYEKADEWCALVKDGKFLGIGKAHNEEKDFQYLTQDLDYPFESEYALSLLISHYHKNQLFTFEK